MKIKQVKIFAVIINVNTYISHNLMLMSFQISDVDQIMGLVQNENIQVQVEAYDVALDMSFPKGADGGLDFGSLKVFDEAKQTCTLKNRGRYEIGFK